MIHLTLKLPTYYLRKTKRESRKKEIIIEDDFIIKKGIGFGKINITYGFNRYMNDFEACAKCSICTYTTNDKGN